MVITGVALRDVLLVNFIFHNHSAISVSIEHHDGEALARIWEMLQALAQAMQKGLQISRSAGLFVIQT